MTFGGVNETNLARVVLADAYCGTAGESTDLNALFAAGKTRIICGPGAILTANLTVTGSGYIVSPFRARGLSLGAFKLTIDGAYRVAGISLSGAGAAFEFGANANVVHLVECACESSSTHGLFINTAANDHYVAGCYFLSNAGDGMRCAAGAGTCRVIGNFSFGNTGFGYNDLSNSTILVANRLDGNTAGALSGTPAIDVGNKKT